MLTNKIFNASALGMDICVLHNNLICYVGCKLIFQRYNFLLEYEKGRFVFSITRINFQNFKVYIIIRS